MTRGLATVVNMTARRLTWLIAGLLTAAGCAAIEDRVDEALDVGDAPEVVAAAPSRSVATTLPIVTPEMATLLPALSPATSRNRAVTR